MSHLDCLTQNISFKMSQFTCVNYPYFSTTSGAKRNNTDQVFSLIQIATFLRHQRASRITRARVFSYKRNNQMLLCQILEVAQSSMKLLTLFSTSAEVFVWMNFRKKRKTSSALLTPQNWQFQFLQKSTK